jgi:dTDP-4-dehydrorhamnose 3,5-epimerase-like enzyme
MLPTVDDLRRVSFELFRDERGTLVPMDTSSSVPFPIKRVFWIYDVPPGGSRGAHAHKSCHQFIVCAVGSVRIEAFDGRAQRFIELAAGQALHVPPAIFTTQWFDAEGSVLLVFCDRAYNRREYMEDRNAFAAHRSRIAALGHNVLRPA